MSIHLNGLTVAGATPVSRPRLFRAEAVLEDLGVACFRPATLVGAGWSYAQDLRVQQSRYGPVKDGAAVLRRQYRRGAPLTPWPPELHPESPPTQEHCIYSRHRSPSPVAPLPQLERSTCVCSSPRRETGPQPASRYRRPGARTTHRTTSIWFTHTCCKRCWRQRCSNSSGGKLPRRLPRTPPSVEGWNI